MTTLTDIQAQVLAYILSEYDRGGPMPTIREIAQLFGWASNHTAYGHITALEKKGALRRSSPKRSYGIVLTHPEVMSVLEVLKAARRSA